MIRVILLSLFAVCVAVSSVPAQAAADKGPDFAERVELARKMNAAYPASKQAMDAVNTAANRLPADKRADFVSGITKSIDTAALDARSVEIMAETFTKAELEKMVAYFVTPEAEVIAKKMAIYQAALQPMVTQMLDKAAMAARTGAATTPPALQKAPEAVPAPAPAP